ncbi:MAG: 30S ribosome-binding factor RbfA [Deltaproteobacteria bacterium]|nr:MAG: 30S ribosome-binding factor RbfA [Deltaproteobacteria bacterium]RUA02370.1 MAG: 30S ribosome-binding factor RbfA [Deltaproteobacteria bacterium]
MRPFSRGSRVGGEIQKLLSELLLRKIKDPRLKMILITGVKMTPDLKLARVYYTSTGQDINPGNTLEGLKSASGFFKRLLAQKLDLRYIPALHFYHDDSFEYGDRIERLLKSVQKEDEANY